MAKLFSKYPYDDHASVHRAGLFNLRDDDLSPGGGIEAGEIISGRCEFSIAEHAVNGLSATVVEYKPIRCVHWGNYFLTCMAVDDLPVGPGLRGGSKILRHKHYVVAEFTSAKAIAEARKAGLPLIRAASGRTFANLELMSVPGRTPQHRRAKLL